MCRRIVFPVAVMLMAAIAAVSQAGEWSDDFSAPRDFLTQGVEGTGWDGFIGLGENQSADAINASIDHPGELHLASTGTVWAPNWSPLGPFLYKVVSGDFVATVEITDYEQDVYYNYCGLMARVAESADAGAGEDWISVSYFPLYNVGIIAQYANDGGRTEDGGGTGQGYSAPQFLQLERVGNTFYLRTSVDGVTFQDYPDENFTGLVRDDLDGLPVQVGMWHATFNNGVGGYVAFDNFHIEGDEVSAPTQAFGPQPSSGATDVVRETELSWKAPTSGAVVAHDVYLGDVLEDVNMASRDNPMGVLVSENQAATSYVPESLLTFGQTYYWRVDEVGADGTIYPGQLWQFEVEPVAYAIEDVNATASSFLPGWEPELTVDGSGLTDDLHTNLPNTMWEAVVPTDDSPLWIEYEFDQPYKLYELWVWNGNILYEQLLGFSIKDATIQYSLNGTDWTTLGDYVFEQGSGQLDYAHNVVIDCNSVTAQYVRINVATTYGGTQVALSEVRFFYKPCTAREPHPASGASNVDPSEILQWRVGREAALHEVYFSEDEQAVIDGTALVAMNASATFVPAMLELGATYYWKVVEVNNAETPSSWESDVWSFSMPEYIVVDNMESYDDEENRIYTTWIDGIDDGSNGGSAVAPEDPPYTEQDLVHGGSQAMFFQYGLDSKTFSEVDLALDGADWTLGNAKTLVVWFRGKAGNATPQLYAKINNGAAINYTGSAASLAAPVWKQWNIDLSTVAGLSNVTSLTLGVSGAGKGTLYIDDIRLYKDASPQTGNAVDPGAGNLMAYFPMDNSVADASGHGYNGTTETGSSFGSGPAGYGQALVLDGNGGHVTLPIGPLVESLTDATFATWVNWEGSGSAWCRIFDFGTGTSNYMFLTPNGGGGLRFAITAGEGESRVTRPGALSAGWHHIAVTIDATAMTMGLYVDGEMVRTGTTATLPQDLGATDLNYLGRSQFDDPYLPGSLDEFRIFNRALSAEEVLYLVGDR